MRRLPIAAALFLACFGTAHAAGSYLPAGLSAPQILAKARAARGSLAPGRYVIVEHLRGGGIERTRVTHIDGPNSIATLQSGQFTSASGFYNGQSWNQDENGLVLIRSDFRRYVDPNAQALTHPEMPANRVSVLGLTSTQPQEYVIDVNPPGGSDQNRYYNAKTFLLDRVVTFDADMYQHVGDFSDYRPVFQTMRAFHVHSYDGRPQNDIVSDTLSFQSAPADSVPVVMPTTRPLYTIEKPAAVPAKFSSSGIVVRVTIQGRGLDFLLDSGASGLFIDPGVAHQLGLTTYGKSTQTIGGDVDISKTRVPLVSIGTLELHDVVFSVVPMSQYVSNGSEVVGILGSDFIAGSVLGIDFQKQTLTLYPSEFDAHALGMITLPIQIDDGVPRVQASFEGVTGAFLMDTGAFATLAYKNYVEKLKSTPLGSDGLMAVGGAVPAEVRRLTDLEFGGIRFGDADVFVPTSSRFNLSDYDGILGRDVLSNYQFFFNYAKREVYIKPAG